MTKTFAQLGLPKPLVRGLAERDITEPFPIQAAAIPDALSGHDVCGKAPTGSGKTLAFGLAVLARVATAHRNKPRALVLAPTRELAEQIKRELAPLGKAAHRRVFAVYGGVGYGPQKAALRDGVDVLVATPGRLEDLIEQGAVGLGDVDHVVIDEADRMADMGFLPAVRRILDRTSPQRQTLLFSATLDGDIAVLSRDYQNSPVRHDAAAIEPETIDAQHHFWLVEHHARVEHAADIIGTSYRSIVFTRTRRGADRLTRRLSRLGVGAIALHGGRTQGQRTRALREFTSGRIQALVATDVAARGIHIDAVESVIHYDPPADSKDYLHRSGRTGRAGATGTIVSLVTHPQRRAVRRIQHDLGISAPIAAPRIDALGERSERPGAASTAKARPVPPSDKTASVYVANLPWTATDRDVADLFRPYGRVHQATVVTDRRTGRSKGFGFVDMTGAPEAIAALHGSELGGRSLTVKTARPRSGKAPAGNGNGRSRHRGNGGRRHNGRHSGGGRRSNGR
jgi:superfamily II DNA/RNA helicase